MKTISRTIEKITIEAEALKLVEGKWENRKLNSYVNSEKNVKEVQKHFESQLQECETFAIVGESKEEKLYSVPVSEFIKLAENKEKEENKEEVL